MHVEQIPGIVKEIFIKHDKFFSKDKSTIFDVTEYVLVLSLVPAVVVLLTSIFFQPLPIAQIALFSPIVASLLPVIMFISVFVLNLVSLFLGSGVLHLFVYLLGGRGFVKTFRSSGYSWTPSLLLGWVPIVNIIASLYGLYLLVIGIKKQHGFTTTRAVIAAILPVLVIFLVIVIAAVLTTWLWAYTASQQANVVEQLARMGTT